MHRKAPNAAIISKAGCYRRRNHTSILFHRFRGFGVPTIKSAIVQFIGLAGRSYNGVSTSVPHCDIICGTLVCVFVQLLMELCPSSAHCSVVDHSFAYEAHCSHNDVGVHDMRT